MKKRMEKELKIFSSKGNIKSTLISEGSALNKEDILRINKIDKNDQWDYNIKVNKKRIKKETSLKQPRPHAQLNIFFSKNSNNYSPKKILHQLM